MLLVVISYSIMLLFATIELRKRYKLNTSQIEEDYIDVLYTKPVSIIVPAFNEEVGVSGKYSCTTQFTISFNRNYCRE